MNDIARTAKSPPVLRSHSPSRGRQAARELLILAGSADITPERRRQVSRIISGNVDWEYLLGLCEINKITPLISYFFTAGGLDNDIPQPYSGQLQKIYSNNLFRNVLLSEELARILTAFKQRGISVVTLKGIVLAEQLYRNLGLRHISDLDILVRADDIAAAGSLMAELGYLPMQNEETWDHPFHEVPFVRQGRMLFFVEIHRELENPALINIPYQDIWDRALPYNVQEVSTLVLSPEDNLLYLANNLAKQNQEALKAIYDIRTLLEQYRDSLDWNYIAGAACAWGIKTAVFSALRRACDIFGEKVPDRVLDNLRPGGFRLKVLDFLVPQRYLLFSQDSEKIKQETLTVFQALLMERFSQTLTVLSRYRDNPRRWKWLKTVFWITLVFTIAAVRGISYLTRKDRR